MPQWDSAIERLIAHDMYEWLPLVLMPLVVRACLHVSHVLHAGAPAKIWHCRAPHHSPFVDASMGGILQRNARSSREMM